MPSVQCALAVAVVTTFAASRALAGALPEETILFADGFLDGDACAWDDVVGLPADGNDSEATAEVLAGTSDCDAPIERGGDLYGRADTDFLNIAVSDSPVCSLDPSFEGSALDGARICLFVACDGGGTQVTCASGASPSTSPAGRPGCCSTTGELIDSLTCTGLDKSATYWFRFDTSPSACAAYALSGHF